jgi:fructoselysine 3-epimerase
MDRKEEEHRRNVMKLSFNTWCYCSFPAWLPAYPIDYVIRSLGKIGYDGIELGCASPVAYPPYMTAADRQKVRGLLKENKIEVSSVLPAPGGGCGNNVASPIEAERKTAVQSYKDCVDLVADLGGKICLYVAGWVIYGVDQDQGWEWSRQCLVEVAAHAKKRGVIIAVEPTPSDSNLVETPDDALKLMRETKSDNVKVMFDTIHALYRKDIPADYVEKIGSDLAHVHISDLERMPPGTFSDFTFLVDALKANGYNGYLAMEIGLGGRGVDANVFAKKSLEYMRKIL